MIRDEISESCKSLDEAKDGRHSQCVTLMKLRRSVQKRESRRGNASWKHLSPRVARQGGSGGTSTLVAATPVPPSLRRLRSELLGRRPRSREEGGSFRRQVAARSGESCARIRLDLPWPDRACSRRDRRGRLWRISG